MSHALNNTRSRLKRRLESGRTFLTNEVDLFKTAISDIVERFNLNTNTEPPGTRGQGGILGHRGSLIKTPIMLVVGTVDNAAQLIQEQASITREVLNR